MGKKHKKSNKKPHIQTATTGFIGAKLDGTVLQAAEKRERAFFNAIPAEKPATVVVALALFDTSRLDAAVCVAVLSNVRTYQVPRTRVGLGACKTLQVA